MFRGPHETGRHSRYIAAAKHDPCASNDGFSGLCSHREIDCVPFAEHVNFTFHRIAISRGLEQSSAENRGISGSQSQGCRENSRFVTPARAAWIQAVVG
jgi:hypothetical protein